METRLYTDTDSLAAIRPSWELWQNQPNNDFDQFLLVCRLRPAVHYPWVMVIYEQDIPLAVLAGRVETLRFSPAIGYLKLPGIPLKTLTVLYQGFLGRQDGVTAECLVKATRHWLSSSDVGEVIFPALEPGSPLHLAVIRQTSVWFCEKGGLPQCHWQSVLPDAGDILPGLMKAKHRAGLRKRQRTLQADFEDRIRWQWLTRFEELSALCQQIERLAARTYQRGLGAGFRDNQEWRERLGLYAARGTLRVALLWIDETLVCFYIGMRYGETLFGAELGYDQAFKSYSPGILLILWLMERVREEGVYRMDWGLGDAQYKQQLGATTWPEQSLYLFKPTPAHWILRSLLGITQAIDQTARHVLEKTDLTHRIKTAWRRRMIRCDQ